MVVFSGELDKAIAALYHCQWVCIHGAASNAFLHLLGAECAQEAPGSGSEEDIYGKDVWLHAAARS